VELPYPSVTPYLYYADPAAALEWLSTAFGFHERRRITAADGAIDYAEMAIGESGVIMFARPVGPMAARGRRHSSTQASTSPWATSTVTTSEPDARGPRSWSLRRTGRGETANTGRWTWRVTTGGSGGARKA